MRFRLYSFDFEGKSEVARVISGISQSYYDATSVDEVVYHRVIADRAISVYESGITLMATAVSVCDKPRKTITFKFRIMHVT